jgi:hypothetical protein
MSAVSRRIAHVVVVAVVVGTVACTPARRNIAPRAAPATATVAIDVRLDDGYREWLVQAAARTRLDSTTDEEHQQQLDATYAYAVSLVRDTASLLVSELPQKNIARVVGDVSAADLLLRGVARGDDYGQIVLHWQLVDPQTSAVVSAGVTEGHVFASAGFVADQVTATLVSADLSRYGAPPTPSLPPAPPPPPPKANPKSSTPGENAWAVVIGVERYRDGLPAATHAADDARAMAQFFVETMNVPESHVRMLLNERAGRADMASILEEWLPRNAVAVGQSGAKNGRVYVSFSGHGAPDPETGDAYLVPYDADPAFLKTRGYAVSAVNAQLEALSARGYEVFVFYDACFSGSGERSVLAAGTRPLVPVKAITPRKGVSTLAAAKPQQTTGAAPGGGHGLFTAHLLTALRGAADGDGDGVVGVGDVFLYVGPRVERDARLQNREQQPTLSSTTPQAPLVLGLAR